MNWSDKLAALARFYADPTDSRREEEPFFLWVVNPPVPFEWPSSLPHLPSLERFYSVCGGGEFGPMIRFVPASRLGQQTARWVETLRQYDERGDVLFAGRHVVFANDSAGAPWIIDATNGRVASFWWKGGDWEEPVFASLDEFMEQYIFRPSPDESDWAKALSTLFGAETPQSDGSRN